jgi:Cu-Zn family superoxide dismutase
LWSRAFFVGTLGDGTIYRGALDDPVVPPFIPGPGKAAVGRKVLRDLLYVAGGPAGDIRVYDVSSGEQVGAFTTPKAATFLNDLVVTGAGDVWVTDSVRPTLWRLTPARVASR